MKKKYIVMTCENRTPEAIYTSYDVMLHTVYSKEEEGYELICECPMKKDAARIAKLLNENPGQ